MKSIINKYLLFLAMLGAAIPLPAAASTPDELLKGYASEAKARNPSFPGFSAARGKAFYHQKRIRADGQTVSCATCHTADPTRPGMTRANKEIAPLAVNANPERLTDPAKVEKWFRRNCGDVLERNCTAEEKGDFIEYLRTIR